MPLICWEGNDPSGYCIGESEAEACAVALNRITKVSSVKKYLTPVWPGVTGFAVTEYVEIMPPADGPAV